MKNEKQYDIPQVPRRILTSLLASVSAGVVPRAGAPYIAIGRRDEIAAERQRQRTARIEKKRQKKDKNKKQ